MYEQCKPVPFFKKKQWENIVEWTRKKLKYMGLDWITEMFTNNKKFNLSEVDGLSYYWYNLHCRL